MTLLTGLASSASNALHNYNPSWVLILRTASPTCLCRCNAEPPFLRRMCGALVIQACALLLLLSFATAPLSRKAYPCPLLVSYKPTLPRPITQGLCGKAILEVLNWSYSINLGRVTMACERDLAQPITLGAVPQPG